MKRAALMPVLLLVLTTALHAQVTMVGRTQSSTNGGSSQWSAGITATAGDALLVGCDYNKGVSFSGVSDSAGDAFVPIGAEVQSTNFAARAYIATNIKGGATTVVCNALASSNSNEIYVTELRGVDPLRPVASGFSASGVSSPARGTLPVAIAGQPVWAFIVSGHVSRQSGWTLLSNLDGNLVASKTPSATGALNASFPTTMDWTLMLTALNPVGGSVPAEQPPPPAPISVSLSPAAASIQAGHSLSFAASVQNDTQNKGVAWNLAGSGCSGTSCGSLTGVTATSATYAAPAQIASTLNLTVTATSIADGTKSAVASLTVTAAPPPAPIGISVSPTTSSLTPGASQSFTATVSNDPANQGATWNLSGTGCSGTSCGTLSRTTASSVVYTAPSNAATPITANLSATAVADATKSATASITVTPPQNSSATPTLVQHVSCSNTLGNPATSYTCILPNGTQPGNAVITGFQYSNGASPSVTDDAGNTYTQGESYSDGHSTVALYYALNVAPGARAVTIHFGGSSGSYVSAVCSEFFNVALSGASDGQSGSGGDGSTVTAGSLTPASSGDLIYEFATSTTFPVSGYTQGASPWQLLSADIQDGTVAQYQVQAAAAAISPSLGQSPSTGFLSAAIALRAGNAGNPPPPGIRIVHLLHSSLKTNTGSQRHQFPSSGNLVVVAYIGETGNDITSVSDGNHNSYASAAPVIGIPGSGDSQLYYAANAATGATMSGPTLSVNGALSNGGTALIYDISGASASPFDAAARASGIQETSGTLKTASVNISGANEIVIGLVSVNAPLVTGLAGPDFYFDATVFGGEPSPSPVDQNNGWGHYVGSPGLVTFSWINNAPSGVQDWSAVAAGFKAP